MQHCPPAYAWDRPPKRQTLIYQLNFTPCFAFSTTFPKLCVFGKKRVSFLKQIKFAIKWDQPIVTELQLFKHRAFFPKSAKFSCCDAFIYFNFILLTKKLSCTSNILFNSDILYVNSQGLAMILFVITQKLFY